MRVKNNYIDNKKFSEAVAVYIQSITEADKIGAPKPQISNYIGECFILIAENLAKRPNFYRYSYKDNMISDGIHNCVAYIKNYDVKYNNAFSYFNRIIWMSFIRRIEIEKTQHYVKCKLFQDVLPELNSEDLELCNFDPKLYDNLETFIGEFEEKERLKKQKKSTTVLVTDIEFIEEILEVE